MFQKLRYIILNISYTHHDAPHQIYKNEFYQKHFFEIHECSNSTMKKLVSQNALIVICKNRQISETH